jgi:hypothetical protein
MRRIALAAATAAALAACSSGTKLSLSAKTGSGAAAASSPETAASALSAGGGVDVTRVRIVVERIKLERVATPVASDGGSDTTSPDDELVTGPYLIDLQGAALSGGISQVFEVDAKAGTYKDLKFRIHKLESGATQFEGMAGLSIAIDGTVGGAPFTFTSSLDEEQEREGTFEIAAEKANNVTLSIDPSAWFVGDGGAPLDPRNGANRSRIESNIKASIDAFDDDDRDGRRDP